MPRLRDLLAGSAFTDGFYGAQDRARDEEFGQLKQVSVLAQLAAQMQGQQRANAEVQRNEVLRQKITALPPDQRTRENIIPLLLESGNVKEIAPLLKDADKPVAIGSGGLRLPDGTVVPPASRPEAPRAQPIGSGGLRLPDGTIVPPAENPNKQPSRPLIQERFPVGESMVQPHISHDNGRTWNPMPGSKPVAAFAKQVPAVVVGDGSGKPPSGFRFTKEGNLEAIPGGPADKPESGGKAPSGYRFKADGVTLEPIPGGPATVQSPEAAAKTELLANGLKDIERFKALVFKDGKADIRLIAGMAVPGGGVPGTNARLAYSYIYNAIEAKLRAESGAAVPEAEVHRMARRFVPSPFDNNETMLSKVDRLTEFLGGSLGRVKGQPGAGTNQVPPTVTGNAPPWNSEKERRYQELLRKRGGS